MAIVLAIALDAVPAGTSAVVENPPDPNDGSRVPSGLSRAATNCTNCGDESLTEPEKSIAPPGSIANPPTLIAELPSLSVAVPDVPKLLSSDPSELKRCTAPAGPLLEQTDGRTRITHVRRAH
jgi:hypothetical protein